MVAKLLKSVREYKKDSILTPLFVTFEVILEVFIPYLMANLIDFGIDKGDMNYILKTGLILLLSAILSLTFGVVAGNKAAVASNGFAKNLRKDMYYNVQNFSFTNIDKFSTASIITRLTTDVSRVSMAYQMIIRMVVRSPAMLIFSLIMSFGIDVKLSLLFLAAIPVLLVGLLFIVKKAFPLFGKVFKIYDKLNRVVQENLRGIRVVKSFVRGENEEEKFKEISNDIYEGFSKAEKTVAFNMPLMQIAMYAVMLLLSWFGARAVVLSGANPDLGLSTGELMGLFTYAMQILSSLMFVSMIFVMLTMSKASGERIVEILNEKSDIVNPENPVTEVKNGEISFENVSFSYGKNNQPALKDATFKINSGEMIGILGSTGSGKSTLVQLIPRLYDVTEGKVSVGGVDVRDYDMNTLRSAVSMVLQKNVLFAGTLKENLRWGNADATDEELIKASKLAQADDFINTFPEKYDTMIEQGGTNLSGGQKQRVCIARAILSKPKILILDDSTSAVDVKTDVLIRKALKKEIPDTTKIIIAQRISSIQDADKIIVMDDGKISAIGKHEELLSNNEIYKEVYESQIKGGNGDE